MSTTEYELDTSAAIVRVTPGAGVGIVNSAAADAGFRIDWDSGVSSGDGWTYRLAPVSKRDVAVWKNSARWPSR